MLRIGLTGGIASGKSAASDCFASLGVPVIDTDLISRELVQPGTEGLQQIIENFGESILDETGMLDRARLRAIVFASDDKRQLLEEILHPAIRNRVEELVAEITQAPYVIIVIPLLFETRYPIPVDRVLLVDVNEDLQLERLIQRDNLDREQARAMLRAQTTRQQRLQMADDIIRNNGSIEELHAQLRTLHHDYLVMADKAEA
jgi:dephospho-CoA kinase